MGESNLTLSLVANFDDLVRHMIPPNTELIDFTIELVKLVDSLNDQLNYSQNEVKMYKEKCCLLELENRKLDANLKNTKEAYKKEVNIRRDTNGMSKIDEIDFSNEALSDGDYDKSEDDLDDQNKNRKEEIRFASNQNLAPILEKMRDEFRFQSVASLTPTKDTTLKPTLLVNSSSKSRIQNRCHQFVVKRLIRSKETCNVCNKKFLFYSTCSRCSECGAFVHDNCKSQLPSPCVPYVTSSHIGKKGRLITISDFVHPTAKPCIPGLIIHFTREIEKKGLDEPGLYRIPGSDSQVKELVEKFLRSKSGIPSLSNVDIHVLCGVVKNFLHRLDDPLITRILWHEFVKAARLDNTEDRQAFLASAISELPLANKHTLAYLMLHFQRVASSPACKMPVSNIAKVLGPTIVGYSMPKHTAPSSIHTEIEDQIRTMEALLTQPTEYWTELLSHPMPTEETTNKRQSVDSRAIKTSRSRVLNPWPSNRIQFKRPLL